MLCLLRSHDARSCAPRECANGREANTETLNRNKVEIAPRQKLNYWPQGLADCYGEEGVV